MAAGRSSGRSSPRRRWSRRLAAIASDGGLLGILAVAALCPGCVRAQATQDVYHVAEEAVDLSIALDSVGVVTLVPLSADSVGSLGHTALGEPVTVRQASLGSRGWILGIPTRSRDELWAAVRQLQSAPGIGWSGLVARTPGATSPALVTDEFLVQFLPGVARSTVDAINQAHGVELLHESPYAPNHFLLRVTRASALDGLAMANLYDQDSRTLYAHPNFFYQDQPSAFFPNDPLFPQQWHLYNPSVSVTPGTPRADIHAPEAWDITRGVSSITIAIVEQDGFDASHPDLKNRLWANPWVTGASPPPEPWSKSGDLHGWNFDGCPSTPGMDPSLDPCGTSNLAQGLVGHGTQVAGVAGAEGNNKIGVSGVCPDCSLMLVRMGFTTAEVRAAAFDYVRVMGADVINASFNTQYNNGTFIDAVKRATTLGRDGKGIAIVAGPFDYTFDENICTASPPLLAGQSNVISVIMSNDHDVRHKGAMGPCLDLMSPGVGIWTTDAGSGSGGYAAVTGNSFAAPVVAGVAGLILSRNPTLTGTQVYDILINTADKVDGAYDPGSGHSDLRGYGRVNAYQALLATSPPSGTTTTPAVALKSSSGFEVGVRVGITAMSGSGSTDWSVGAPAAGPLAAPVIYGSWLPSSAIFDLQLGFARAWSSGTSPDELRLHTAVLGGLRIPFISGSLYLGVSAAQRHVDVAGMSSSNEWGVGGAAGIRWTLGAKLALRTELLYRRWAGLSLDESGLAVGLGVRLP